MSFWDRLRFKMEDDPIDDDDPYEESTTTPDPYEPPSDLATILTRVVEYRNAEVRDLRARAYEAEAKMTSLTRDYELMKYERNEALQRVAKIFAILNQKQQKQLEKAPFEFKLGPPPLQMHVFDPSIADYRRIDVPAPAKMETVRRKGSHGGAPLEPVITFQADQKTAKSNRDIEREQATLRQSRRGK